MYPILFSIGNFNVYTHGVIAVLGIVAASTLIYKLASKRQLDREYFFDNTIFTILFGIIGARLSYFFLYRYQFSSFKEIINLWDGGLVSYGGFIVGGVGYVLLLLKQKQKISSWLDITALGFFLGLFIGRIGDLFAGEYNGIRSSFSIPWIGANNVVPVSFYEALLCLIIFIIFYNFKERKIFFDKPGLIASSSVMLYSFVRFILDFWRTEEQVLAGIAPGQITSLIIFVISFIFAIVILKRRTHGDR